MKALNLLITLRDDYIHGELDCDVNESIEELENLQNRSCDNCQHGNPYTFSKDLECTKLGADTQGLIFERDFYCKY